MASQPVEIPVYAGPTQRGDRGEVLCFDDRNIIAGPGKNSAKQRPGSRLLAAIPPDIPLYSNQPPTNSQLVGYDVVHMMLIEGSQAIATVTTNENCVNGPREGTMRIQPLIPPSGTASVVGVGDNSGGGFAPVDPDGPQSAPPMDWEIVLRGWTAAPSVGTFFTVSPWSQLIQKDVTFNRSDTIVANENGDTVMCTDITGSTWLFSMEDEAFFYRVGGLCTEVAGTLTWASGTQIYGVGRIDGTPGAWVMVAPDASTTFTAQVYTLNATDGFDLLSTPFSASATYRYPQGFTLWSEDGTTYYLAFLARRTADGILMLFLLNSTTGAIVTNYPKVMGTLTMDDAASPVAGAWRRYGCLQADANGELFFWMSNGSTTEGIYVVTPTLDASANTPSLVLNTYTGSGNVRATAGATFCIRPNGDILWAGATVASDRAFIIFKASGVAALPVVEISAATPAWDFNTGAGPPITGNACVWYDDQQFYVGASKTENAIGPVEYPGILRVSFAGAVDTTNATTYAWTTTPIPCRSNGHWSMQMYDVHGEWLRTVVLPGPT